MYKIAAALLSALTLWSAQLIELSQTQQDELGIQTQALTEIQTLSLGKYNAKVVQSQKDVLSLSLCVSGRVEAIYVQKFARVKQGQKLLSLQSSELLEMQQAYIDSQIQNAAAQVNYERDVKLEAKGVIAKKRVLETKRQLDSRKTFLALQKNKLLAQGFNTQALKKLENTQRVSHIHDIFAPKDGVIYGIDVSVGESVEANKMLMQIYADAKRFLEIRLPLDIASKVAVGDMCVFEAQKAEVVSISEVVDEASQSLLLRARLVDDRQSKINQIYEVTILKNLSHAFMISKSSVVFVDAQAFVFKKEAEGFRVFEIEILAEEAQHYTATSQQLSAGDHLAISATAALLGAMEQEDE
jgi:multidrug efflux pump subunit AcrA (membrane-fusion protein)